MMTLDEAIKHAEVVAVEKESDAQNLEYSKLDWRHEANQCSECASQHRQLAEWLKDYKRLLEQTKWTPVSEGDPNIHSRCMKYLVTDYHRHIHTSLFTESGGKGLWSHSGVIAWMPLPKPYKAESEE